MTSKKARPSHSFHLGSWYISTSTVTLLSTPVHKPSLPIAASQVECPGKGAWKICQRGGQSELSSRNSESHWGFSILFLCKDTDSHADRSSGTAVTWAAWQSLLGTKLWSSARAEHALNHWATSPSLSFIICWSKSTRTKSTYCMLCSGLLPHVPKSPQLRTDSTHRVCGSRWEKGCPLTAARLWPAQVAFHSKRENCWDLWDVLLTCVMLCSEMTVVNSNI